MTHEKNPMKPLKLEIETRELTSVELEELGRKLGNVIEKIWMKEEQNEDNRPFK